MTSNISRNRSRKLLAVRVGAVAGLLAVAGFTGLIIAQSQSQNTAAAATTESTATVAETSTVSTGTLTTTLDTVGNLEPTRQTTLTFSVSAPVTAIFAEAGSRVQAGQVLATLDTAEGEARVRQSQLSLAQQRLSLDDLLSPASDLETEAAQLQIDAARASLYSASSSSQVSDTDVQIAQLQVQVSANSVWQAQLSRDQRMDQEAARSGGDVSYSTQLSLNSSVTSAESNLELAQLSYEDTASGGSSNNYSQIVSGQASLANAEASLEELQAGAAASEQRLAEISVEQAQIDLDSAERDLQNYALVAPFEGTVADESLTLGVLSASGSVTLIDMSAFTLDVSIAESDVSSISVGQPVSVTVQALPDAELMGTVTFLDVVPTTSSNGVVTYNATITLDPAPDVALRPGMSAVASIILEQHEDVVLVPNRFLTTDTVTGATSVMVESEPGVYTDTPVTLGARGASESEVASGLEVGQTIVLLVTESDVASSQAGGGFGFGGLLGGGGQPPAGFSPPSGGQPPAGFSLPSGGPRGGG